MAGFGVPRTERLQSTVYSNLSTFSRFNLDEDLSDIQIFIKEYRDRVNQQLNRDLENATTPFITFDETKLTAPVETWLKDNYNRFFKDTPNEFLVKESYLSELGYITSMVYSPDGEFLIVGHCTGLIQMRHGHTGVVVATLRNIQFPPRPIYSLEFSRDESRICYAACCDGNVYRITIPELVLNEVGQPMCIRSDPTLDQLTTQYYGSPGSLNYAAPFITHRTPALALGITADSTKMIVGYGDTSMKVFDMETQQADLIFKVHKLRLQFVPRKLQRVHTGQVVAVCAHNEKPPVFATASWDKTLRIWDIRCTVGCVRTFEGVNVCHDSIDLNRDQAVSGSWQATEALNVWDLKIGKRLNIIRVQNRRPDVDGEFIYACKYWRSSKYNRKGKYVIIGGSGTGCVEVINLHNRYITCSYPAAGTVLAIASYEDRIAFGGTAPVFNIATFHDPKHEKYHTDVAPEYNCAEHAVTLFEFMDFNSDNDEFRHKSHKKPKVSTATDVSKDSKDRKAFLLS